MQMNRYYDSNTTHFLADMMIDLFCRQGTKGTLHGTYSHTQTWQGDGTRDELHGSTPQHPHCWGCDNSYISPLFRAETMYLFSEPNASRKGINIQPLLPSYDEDIVLRHQRRNLQIIPQILLSLLVYLAYSPLTIRTTIHPPKWPPSLSPPLPILGR